MSDKAPLEPSTDRVPQHAPLPWRVSDDGDGIAAPDQTGGNIVCLMPDGWQASMAFWAANAAFIVTACNAHDELKEALSNLVALASPHFSDETQMLALKLARAALTKGGAR